MKKIFSTMILLLVFSAVFGIKNWKTYTNTTHIYEATEIEGKIYLATWGGITVFNPNTNSYEGTYTTADGLQENEIRSISNNDILNQIFAGTKSNGIERISDGEFLNSLETNANITKIVCTDSLTFVANREGISLYKVISSWPIPVLWDTYNNNNGLSSVNVNDFVVTGDNKLIVATDSGLDIVDIDQIDSAESWNNYNINNSDIPANEVLSVYGRNGMVVVGTTNGLVTFEMNNIDDSWVVSETGKNVRALFIDSSNKIWYGFGKWNDETLSVEEVEEVCIKSIDSSVSEWNMETFNHSSAMGFIEIDEKIYAYFWGEGIFLFNNGNWIKYKDNNISASLVRDMTIDNNGNLWVSNGYRAGSNNPPLPRGTKGVSKFDGTDWVTYNFSNSDIISNNIYSLAADRNNNIWMGAWWADVNPQGWEDGISVYDQSNDAWTSLHESDGLRNGTVTGLIVAEENRIWASCAGIGSGGVSVFDESLELLEDFELFRPYVNTNGYEMDDPNVSFIGKDALYIGGGITGIRIWTNWDGTNFPIDDGDNWELPLATDLITGRVYAITSLERNGKEEIWVGTEKGLFQYAYSMGDNNLNSPGYYWFKYSPHIKRSVYWRTGGSYGWYDTPNAFYYYIEGQERLYGGELTFPTALFVDPFGIVWIGTDSNGITMYDPDRDVFKTYNKENSPLVSNVVTDLAYDEITGYLYIGTDDGLSAVQIGIGSEFNTEKDLKKTVAFPNPFKPGNGDILRIENSDKLTMPKGDTKCNIYDLNGNLVRKLDKDDFEQFSWDGNNEAGKECSSGIYFYVVSTSDGQTDRGKIALIR